MKNKTSIKLDVIILVLLGTMLIIYGGFELYKSGLRMGLAFHNIDLSFHKLIEYGAYDWFIMEDVIGYSQVNETVEYNSLPYPAIYSNGVDNIFSAQHDSIIGMGHLMGGVFSYMIAITLLYYKREN